MSTQCKKWLNQAPEIKTRVQNLQICRSEPAVWDAMIAISSLFENTNSSSSLSPRQGQSQNLSQNQQDALDWYSRSVSSVRQGIERGGVGSFVGLITCILFICIESILGSLKEATHLYGQGVHLILTLWAQKSSGVLTATQASLLRDMIIPIFIRLASFSPKNTWGLAITMVQETEYALSLPEQFSSLKSAREAIVMLSAEISLFEQICEQYLQNSHAWQIPEDMACQQKTLSARLESWNIAFINLIDSFCKKDDSSPLHVSIGALLSSHYEMLYVILAVCGSPLRITTDKYTRNFQTIVKKAAVALNNTARYDSTQAPYTFELGLGLPLWFTCLRCREPTTRRAALALLRRTHQVQGFSKRDQGAALIELIMMLEETSATVMNAAEVGDNITSPQTFDEFTDYESYSQGSSVSSSPFSTLQSEVAAASSSLLTEMETEPRVVIVIPQEARIRPHGAFQLGDDLPAGLVEEDILKSNLISGQTYLHISRNEHDLCNNTWRMVHDFIPMGL
ncbi:conserved hypothetical protein [Talaromyces marneffei ATCC 18224]|uniref:Uncharacterized protein n=1 Tax=Talaromyces marneffei (strain ATCC 18224 / CBS 334.59 / QM 7333) TaxID=441960 RepID=B6QU36_TALMQ|nr:conserved hypothetical protein [Talaromyces marneffei ATCC 18224]